LEVGFSHYLIFEILIKFNLAIIFYLQLKIPQFGAIQLGFC